jgi:nitroimidazol reductase NimA-like FMN-containing flavoprotein (pyridoxamine 5'-phosphate oxidase superfamily)
MRVAKKEMRDREAVDDVLRRCAVGRLGTVGPDGLPMIKPLNYVFPDGAIYFHSAHEGEKIDDIRRESRVCFEVDIPLRYVRAAGNPCAAAYRYQSVIIKGRARMVDNPDERLRALQALMAKYQPEGGYGDFPEEKLALTAVVAIDIVEITGKEDVRE